MSKKLWRTDGYSNVRTLEQKRMSYTSNTIVGILKSLKRMTPNHQITMLKFIKNLSMLATTHDALQNSNAIEVLTDLLESSMKLPHFREISNQVLNILYNLCRLSKARQEDAAENGLIPLLQHIVHTEWPLKEFALPILCDMAHSGKVGRGRLWQHNGLQFYISLLGDRYWQVTALDAICIWYVFPAFSITPLTAIGSKLRPPRSKRFSLAGRLVEPLSSASRTLTPLLMRSRTFLNRCRRCFILVPQSRLA